MLIHNFGDETQGFQAPVDHNDRLKAEIPKKLHFMKETFAMYQHLLYLHSLWTY